MPNQNQSEAWNGAEGAHYTSHVDRYDRQLAPFTDALFDAFSLDQQASVLDVGCGCGEATRRAASLAGSALGVDISRPLVDVATERAAAASLDNARFLVADAQIHHFDQGAFDVVLSQFGLMFFDDPVGAFTNLHRALKSGGQLAFVCWRALGENEWVSVVADAVQRHVTLPDLGGLDGGPGMFALKNDAEIDHLLRASGFSDIHLRPTSPQIVIGGGADRDDAVDFYFGMGIVRGLLGNVDPDQRSSVDDEVRSVLLERHEPGLGIRLGAGGWLVTASG